MDVQMIANTIANFELKKPFMVWCPFVSYCLENNLELKPVCEGLYLNLVPEVPEKLNI
jgi:hypothetical protein